MVWLVTTAAAAAGATIAELTLPKKYNFKFLALMLWGATVMILVDRILNYEGGRFIELSTDGMIENGVVLGLVMLVPVFITWGVSFFIKKGR